MSKKVKSSFLHVDDVDRATRYYQCVFGADLNKAHILKIGRFRFGLTTDAAEEQGASTLSFADPDVIVARAAAKGGRIIERCADGPEGRAGLVEDPFGHRWRIRGR